MFGIGRPAPREEVVKGELSQSLDHLKQAADHATVGIDAAVTPRIDAVRGYLSPAAARLMNATSKRWGSAMIAFSPLATAAAERTRRADTAVRKARSLQMRNGMMMQGLRSMMGLRNRTMMPGMPMMKSMRNMTGMRGRNGRNGMRGMQRSQLTGMLIAGAAIGTIATMIMRRRRQQQWEEYSPGLVMGREENIEPMMSATAGPGMAAMPGASASGMAAMPGASASGMTGRETAPGAATMREEELSSAADAAEQALRNAAGRSMPDR